MLEWQGLHLSCLAPPVCTRSSLGRTESRAHPHLYLSLSAPSKYKLPSLVWVLELQTLEKVWWAWLPWSLQLAGFPCPASWAAAEAYFKFPALTNSFALFLRLKVRSILSATLDPGLRLQEHLLEQELARGKIGEGFERDPGVLTLILGALGRLVQHCGVHVAVN